MVQLNRASAFPEKFPREGLSFFLFLLAKGHWPIGPSPHWHWAFLMRGLFDSITPPPSESWLHTPQPFPSDTVGGACCVVRRQPTGSHSGGSSISLKLGSLGKRMQTAFCHEFTRCFAASVFGDDDSDDLGLGCALQLAGPMQEFITKQTGTVSMLQRSPNNDASLVALRSAISAHQGPGVVVNLT
jgi:hypothetical protein